MTARIELPGGGGADLDLACATACLALDLACGRRRGSGSCLGDGVPGSRSYGRRLGAGGRVSSGTTSRQDGMPRSPAYLRLGAGGRLVARRGGGEECDATGRGDEVGGNLGFEMGDVKN